MQAQPQSNLAARIPSHPASPLPQTPPRAPARLLSLPAASLPDSSGLAHDAGNLLAALGLYSDLLHVPGVLRPEHQHYATELRLISERSATLIRRLLAAPAPPAPAPTDESPLVAPKLFRRTRNGRASDPLANPSNHAAMLLSLAPVLQRIAAGAACVSVNCPGKIPPLSFPSEIIERITVNLVRNAAEAIRLQQASASSVSLPLSGQIRVTLAVTPDRLQLTVEDNGPGMSPSNVEAYLHPSPLPAGASHGLGHRIVHDLAISTGGQLSIRVRPGQGTTFCLKWSVFPIQSAEPCTSDVPPSPSTE